MKLDRPASGARGEPITALIDVVFFLLVFFMLIGRMDATAPFDVAPPVVSSAASLPSGGVTLSVSEHGALALNSEPVDQAAVAKALATLQDSSDGLRLRINAHREVSLRHVLPLLSVAEAQGFDDIVLIVTPSGATVR